MYAYDSHILDYIYTKIVWGFQFGSMDHGIVVPGLGGTATGYHAHGPIISVLFPAQI